MAANQSENLLYGKWNYSDYQYTVEDYDMETLRMHGVVYSSIFAIWTFILNSLILVIILNDQNMRSNSIYLQVVNFSISNITQTIFVNTFAIYNDVSPWYLGVFLCKTWIILDVLIPLVSSNILILMHLDILCYFIQIQKYNWVKTTKVLMPVPWMISCVIVLPLWLSGSIRLPHEEGQCVFALNIGTAITSQILTFLLPLVVSVILIVIISIKYIRTRGVENEEYSLQSLNELHHIEREQYSQQPRITKALSAVTVVFYIMWLPYQIIVFSLINCSDDSCIPPFEVLQSTMLIGAATSGVAPTFWLIDSKQRKKLKQVLCRQ